MQDINTVGYQMNDQAKKLKEQMAGVSGSGVDKAKAD